MEFPLPKKLESIVDGKVEWQSLGRIEYDVLGFFLSCHLIVEHYLNKYIELHGYGNLNWSEVRLTFSQKTKLLKNHEEFEVYNPIPSLKHFNSVRNKIAHNIAYQITAKDVEPLRGFLVQHNLDTDMDLSTPIKVIDQYMYMVCTFFAGAITRGARDIHEATT